jgi:hypothetical protein
MDACGSQSGSVGPNLPVDDILDSCWIAVL